MANIIPGVTTAQQAADIINNDRAKIGGDSEQDFDTKNIKSYGYISSRITGAQQATYLENSKLYSQIPATGAFFNLGLNYDETILAKPNGNFQAVSFTPFTGCHIILNEGQNFKIGELICIEAIESEDKKQPDWRGRYAKKNKKGIFGIVFDEYEEPKAIPEVGVNKFYSIACLGDMKVFCNGENGNIEYGDELCASSIPGVAMKFTGSWANRKQICGKAGRSHTFTSDEVVLIDTAKE